MPEPENLRAYIAREMNRSELDDDVWEDEKVQELIGFYRRHHRNEEHGTEALEDVITEAKRVDKLLGKRPRAVTVTKSPEKKRRDPLPRGVISVHEEARAEAQAAHLKWLASTEPTLHQFWEEMFGYIPEGLQKTRRGRLLTEEEALAFVTSPVLRCYPRWQCELLNIPLVGHTAEFIEDAATAMPDGRLQRKVVLQVDGIRRSVQWSMKAGKKPPSVMYDAAPIEADVINREQYFLREGSVIDRTRRLADKFLAAYGWEEAPTLRFILTGDAPPVHPIQGETTKWRTSTGSVDLEEITLVVKPWVSEETLIKMYREGQRRIHVEQNISRQRTKLRNIRIYSYVTERTDVAGKRPPWQKLTDLWNADCSLEDRLDHRWNFCRAYQSGKRAVWM